MVKLRVPLSLKSVARLRNRHVYIMKPIQVATRVDVSSE